MGLQTIAVASKDAKLDTCAKCGANALLAYKSYIKKEFIERVLEITDKKGCDYILDPIFA